METTKKNETKVTAAPGTQELFVVREFDATREMLFKAYTDPELLVQWFGTRKSVMKVDHMNYADGGSYRFVFSIPATGFEFAFKGSVHEVTAPERIIVTAEMEGMPEPGHVCLETIRFEALPGNRTRVTTQDVFQTVADRDAAIASGMEHGLAEGNIRLDELLEKMS